MCNDVTKSDLKYETGIDPSKFAKKPDLACLKVDADILDIDKLKTTLVDLSKVSNVVKMVSLKRLCMTNWLKKLILLILVI